MSTGKVIDQTITKHYAMYHGDCVHTLSGLPDNSLHLGISSPPFVGMYVYSNSAFDMGNVTSIAQMIEQFRFLGREILRVLVPGRSVFFHLTQAVAQKLRDGYMGLRDFRGPIIDMMISEGFNYYGEITIDKDPQALKNGTNVLTPDGWKPIETIKVNDTVIGAGLKATGVTGTFSHVARPMYKVSFNDGQSIHCDADHLWTVYKESVSKDGTKLVMTTKELIEHGLRFPDGRIRYRIPILSSPVQFASKDILPLDPYMLGALLGDGSLSQKRSVAISTDPEIIAQFSLPDGHYARAIDGTQHANGQSYTINGNAWHSNVVMNKLKVLGLKEMKAEQKFIPQEYLFSSVEDRKRLLQGLLDTDGTCKLNHSVKFSTISPALAKDIRFLVQSLAGLCLVRKNKGSTYKHNGEIRHGKDIYELTIQLAGDWCPFTLPRKAKNWSSRCRGFRRNIVSIEQNGISDCTCISVESDDSLFVTEGCVITHNCKAMRTKDHGLMFKSLASDSAKMHVAMPDFILQFQKPGDNPLPIRAGYSEKYENTNGWVTSNEWINWARPIWYSADYMPGTWREGNTGESCSYGIRETDVLNVRQARDTNDERHLCPLQIGVIERIVKVWSAPDEIVFDPFGGIGSTGYVALQENRRFVGCELKQSYYQSAVRNLESAVAERSQTSLFDIAAD